MFWSMLITEEEIPQRFHLFQLSELAHRNMEFIASD